MNPPPPPAPTSSLLEYRSAQPSNPLSPFPLRWDVIDDRSLRRAEPDKLYIDGVLIPL